MINPLRDLASLIWPPVCPLCGRVSVRPGAHVCDMCLVEIPRYPQPIGVHIPIPRRRELLDPADPWLDGVPDGVPPLTDMEERLYQVPGLQRASFWMLYRPRNSIGTLIKRMKYHGVPGLGLQLGAAMAAEFAAIGYFSDIQAIVPVPIHPLRRLKRGYNQTEYLARGIGRATGLPVLNMLRVRRHASQTTRTHRERRSNVMGLFSARRGVTIPAGIRHLLLVDDVCTTGSTLLNAAWALAELGRSQGTDLHISILTLASTNQPGDTRKS